MKRFLTLVLVVASLFAYSQTKNQPDGEIRGNVIDQGGNRVPSATVYAIPQGITFDGITPRSVKTNANGEFDFRGAFQLGAYKIYSRKAEDAYPDRSDAFYADSTTEAPKVDLTEDHPSATITVTMGGKAGVLVGRVVDVDTGEAVKAKLVFMDEDGNDHSVFANGKYRALLPPGKDLTLMVIVMSPNYRPQSPSTPLRLEPGQEMHKDIQVAKQ
jgi:hypothetical protein